MINRVTSDEYAVQIKNAIISRNNNYDTEIGPIPDLIINPMSGVFELQNERIRAVQQLLSLINDGSFTDQDLDDFVYNEGLIRLPGSKAQVTLTFSRATRPTTDLTVDANFPVGTLADESTSQAYTFLTIERSTLVAANAGSYFNNDTQRYELNVAALALLGASATNVGTNRIIRPLRPLVNFDSVTNKDAAAGGADSETNSQLINRYFLSLVGSSPVVVSGINKILRDQYSSVLDSNVVFGNNPLNVRSSIDGGAVDIYVIGSAPAIHTETIVFSGVEQTISLSKQPVVSILSAGAYTQDTDFVLVKDTDGYAGSIRASDGIKWIKTGSHPNVGEAVTVTYTYNALMSVLQTAFLQDDKNSPSRDILFKMATRVDITLSATVKVKAGFSSATVKAALASAILALVNGYLLDNDVEASDIQAVARSFSSVDNFVITNLSKVGLTGTSDIVIGANEYPRMLSSALILT